jgi:Tol biopolymer transport system component
VRSSIFPPEKVTFNFSGPRGGPPAISPNGQTIVFAAFSVDGKSLLWTRPLKKLAAQPLPGTEGAAFPFWSPDNQFVGFFAGGKLKKVEIASGNIQTICEAGEGRGGTWNREGTIVLAPHARSMLVRVQATGGSPVQVTTLTEPNQTTHRWPSFLPDGKHFLYLAGNVAGTQVNDIYVASLDSKQNKLLLHANSPAIYAQGYLLFLRDRTLMAQRFNWEKLELVGESEAIADDINGWKPIRSGFFSASHGVLAYHAGESGAASQLSWFNRQGKQVGALGESLPFLNIRLSGDQAKLAVVLEEPAVNIWLYDLSRAVKTRFTSDLGPDISPVWSPDGSRIVYASAVKGPFALYQKAVNGSEGAETLFYSGSGTKLPTDWSPDGRFVAFEQLDPAANTKTDIWILPMFGDRKPFPFANTQFDERSAQFSPNGKWMAYTSDESGEDEVYIAPFPGPGTKLRVSAAGGAQVKWRRDGKELFFLAPDKKLMSAEVKENGSKLEIGTVRALFPINVRAGSSLSTYDVSADGQRFLFNGVTAENLQPLTLVTNWTADLKK